MDDRLFTAIHTVPNSMTVSPNSDILASVIQGSAVGPSSFIVTASDLKLSQSTLAMHW